MGTIRKSVAILAATLSILTASPLWADYERGEFTFAKSRIEGFELEAVTFWSADNSPPSIHDVVCRGDNQDIHFVVNRNGGIGGLSTQFLTDPDEAGERENGTYLGDQLWLYVDGERFEFRNISSPGGSFTNSPYTPNEQGEIILTWRGTQAVRRNDAEAFHPLAGHYEQMVDARKLEWSMKLPDLSAHRDRKPKLGKRYRIDNKGLKQAVEWCRSTVISPAARTMPADLLERLTKPK